MKRSKLGEYIVVNIDKLISTFTKPTLICFKIYMEAVTIVSIAKEVSLMELSMDDELITLNLIIEKPLKYYEMIVTVN